MVSYTLLFWMSLVFIQTAIIISLLTHRAKETSDQVTIQNSIPPPLPQNPVIPFSLTSTQLEATALPNGVAVTVLLHAPKWFQRRYTMMVQNIKSNLPKDWVVQVFYTGEGQSLAGIDLNLGLKKMIANGEVILTKIPKALSKKKRIHMMTDPWLWENMLADRVLLFGGNSVICGNSPLNITYFDEWDYIGTPWNSFKGMGGDGGISLRNRPLMLEIIRSELANTPETERDNIYKTWGQEDMFFVSRLKKMMSSGRLIKLAPRSVTKIFGASENMHNENVLAVSGTLAGLSFEERDVFLAYCLELKMIYPSLHDPNCFGAKPNGEKCAENICALKPKKGGC
eukprot:gene6899-14007_t